MKACSARERASRMLREAGYTQQRARGGSVHDEDEAADRKMVTKAIHEHDEQMHGGKLTRLKIRSGGKVPGGASMSRPDRRARGGSTSDGESGSKHNGKKHKSKVEIHIDASQKSDPTELQQARQQGMQQGAQMLAQRIRAAGAMGGAGGPQPPTPPMGPPPGAAPAGGPPMAGGAAIPPRPGAVGVPQGPPAGPPMPMRARGGLVQMRDGRGRFLGGGI